MQYILSEDEYHQTVVVKHNKCVDLEQLVQDLQSQLSTLRVKLNLANARITALTKKETPGSAFRSVFSRMASGQHVDP